MAARPLTTHPLVLRRVEVVRTEQVTEHMLRVTVGGPQLGAFDAAGRTQPAFASPAFDDHVKLIFADGVPATEVLPEQLPFGIEWTRTDKRQGRDYTPRRVDAQAQEMDLDFVLGHEGPASDWALTAHAGDELWMVGPKSSTVLPEDLDWVVLLGDETALPAIARFLEERPSASPVHVHVMVRDRSARVDLSLRPEDSLTWHDGIVDGGAPLRILRELDWPEGLGYVWAAAESSSLVPVRKFLRQERGLSKSQVNITGYWHHQEQRDDSGDDAVQHDAAAFRPLPRLPAVSEVRDWMTVRVALRIGLLDALNDRPGSAAQDLGERTTASAGSLAVVLAALRELELVQGTAPDDADGAESWALTAHGAALVEDEHSREDYDGFHADQVLAMLGLPEAPQGASVSGWHAMSGATVDQHAHQDPEVEAELAERAGQLSFVLAGLFAETMWAEISEALFYGPGAETIREAFAAHEPLQHVRTASMALSAGALAGADTKPDVVVAVLAFMHCTDEEIVSRLAALRDTTSRLVVLEPLRQDALAPRPAAADMQRVAMTGAAPRDRERFAALAEHAGWESISAQPLGWGFESLQFRG